MATIGVLMLRSYILSNDAAHYDAVIDALEAKGVCVIPAFAGGLDGRPAIDRYFHGIDAMISLTGFSLVGGPAYNDADAAVEALKALDIPYLAAHPLEFQTLDQWATSNQGLGPVETTMLVALPEIDGATNSLFCRSSRRQRVRAANISAPVHQIPCNGTLPRTHRRFAGGGAARGDPAAQGERDKNVGIVLFGFPPMPGRWHCRLSVCL